MKEGAFDYLVKPFGEDEVLRVVQALAMRALVVENLLLKRQVRDQFARAHVIGSSPTWNRVYQMVQQVAPSRATVLLTGKAVREGTHCRTVASSQSTCRASLYCAERRGHARHTPGGGTLRV